MSASGGAKDDKGNSVEVKVEQSSDGSGKVSVSVSHTEKDSHTEKGGHTEKQGKRDK